MIRAERYCHPCQVTFQWRRCRGNVVFRDGLPTALIDFDLAKPTTRLDEVANALYWWAPLLDPVDRAPSFVDLDIPDRVALFAEVYGLDAGQRQALVPLIQERSLEAASTRSR